MGNDVTRLSLAVINGSKSAMSVSMTNIVLILKVTYSRKVSNFKLISLCNATLKSITKAITNYIKGLLPLIISECQSSFVLGRLIFDNFLF